MPHATSIHKKRRVGQTRPSARVNPVALPPNCLDRLSTDLGAQSPDVDVDHVGPGIETVTPHRSKNPLLADRLAGAGHQLAQQKELAFREQGPSEFTVSMAT